MKKFIFPFLILLSFLSNAQVKTISETEFYSKFVDESGYFINSKAIVIEFYTDDCDTCQKMFPVFEKVAKKYSHLYDFYKVNIDHVKDMLKDFKIEGIPKFVFVPADKKGNGLSFYYFTGLITEEELITLFDDE